jgi:hypothetical protein
MAQLTEPVNCVHDALKHVQERIDHPVLQVVSACRIYVSYQLSNLQSTTVKRISFFLKQVDIEPHHT